MLEHIEPCYQPLGRKEFRLLTIHPGSANAETRCELRHEQLDSLATPQWQTVSYCWGDPHRRVPLAVNAQSIQVPNNAKDAIARLRLPNVERTIWIDSVCINQADLQERSLQVASMGRIYRKATGNLIFLGDALNIDTERIVRNLHSAAERIRSARVHLSQTEEMGFMTGLAPNHWLTNGTVRVEEMSILEPLYQSRWLTRLWVVQEASLAKENTCIWGASSFPLEDVILCASPNTKPTRFDVESSKGVYAAATMRQFVVPSLQAVDLVLDRFHTYLPIIRTMITTDPRDRVFAILDLFRLHAGLNALPPLLAPDYMKPVSEVFRDATRFALAEPASGGLLNTICHRSDADMIAHGYTSWTKRFDRQFSPKEDCISLRSAAATFPLGSSDYHLEVTNSEDPGVLKVKGWVIGRLTWSSETAVSAAFLSVDYETAKSLADAVFARCVTVAAFQTYGMDDGYSLASDVLSTGSLGDMDFQFDDRTARQHAFRLYLEYLHEHGTLPPRSGDAICNESIITAAKFHKLFSNQTHRRRCFQLGSGHVGIGPGIASESDVLVICNGAEHPYVLRPVGSEYQFVGAAYVPGLMAGQVFHLNLESTWFRIR